MATFKVRLIKLSNGKLYPVLVMDSGRPIVLPNLWAEDLIRYRRLNTARTYLADISVFYRSASRMHIDVHERISNLSGFRRMEVQQLVADLFLTSAGAPTTGQTGKRRIQAVRSFLNFAFDVYGDLVRGQDKRIAGEKMKARVLGQIARYGAIHRSRPSVSNCATCLSTQELAVVADVLHPSSESNPFATAEVRFRNFCMFMVAKETWVRRSELVLLEISDLDLGASPMLTIKRPNEGNLSKRRDGAGFKTLSRVVPITDGLSKLLAYYLREIRPRILGKRVISTALFPSLRDGRRLSVGAMNAVLAATKRVPELVDLGKRIHPHGIRTSAADEFHTLAVGLNVPNLQDCMEYVGGWRHGSGMPARYAASAVREQVRRLARKRP